MKFNYWCTVCCHEGLQVIEKPEEDENKPEQCIFCDTETPLKLMGRQTGAVIGKFANMTPAQRSEVLKKRSHEHFLKEGKEVKHQMLKDSFGKMGKQINEK